MVAIGDDASKQMKGYKGFLYLNAIGKRHVHYIGLKFQHLDKMIAMSSMKISGHINNKPGFSFEL